MNVISIGQNIGLIILAFSVVFIARIISTYPILSVINRFTREKIPTAWRHTRGTRRNEGGTLGCLGAPLPSEV